MTIWPNPLPLYDGTLCSLSFNAPYFFALQTGVFVVLRKILPV